ncbi:MAG: hypothetical protein PVF45_07915 [Anaerolineae bacterium]|jgi:hypothetical protein
MPYLIVKGTFHVVGKSPDGDTVSFRPLNQEHWLELTGERVPRMNRHGDVSIRFEAIDALETHYRGKMWLPELHQPATFADQARDLMLSSIGIPPNEVVWSGNRVKSAPDGTAGYIATNGVDPFNRVIAFVFAGDPPTEDGDAEFRLFSEHVRKSVNFKLAQEGLVYPAFYAALYPSLRQTIADACVGARTQGKGLWAHDTSTTGVKIPNPSDLSPITEAHCIFPKLFRRLATHLCQNGSVRNFKGYLYDQVDLCVRIDNCEMSSFGRFVRVDKEESKVSLKIPPEQFLFVPG